MASVNKVILLGNCGRDPEIRYLPSGQAVANVTLATSTKRKDKNTGEMVEDTQWHRITFFDRLAEIAGEYVKKGNPIYIEGRLKYGKFTNKDGVEQNTCDIIATEMQLLGGREGRGSPSAEDGGGSSYSRPAPASRPAAQAPRQAPAPAKSASGFDDMDDDIPFWGGAPYHATHAQIHSEFKTDMDLERLPSGKFDTHFLVCAPATVAMNISRQIGQNALTG